jgi:hypothetical protein
MENCKKVLLVASSLSDSKSSFNGIKIKLIQQIKTKLDKSNINLTIATLNGVDPIIQYQNDESSKIWANNMINKEIQLIDIKNINENEFLGIIVPSYSSIFKELNDETNKLQYTLSKLNFQKKILCCLGHGSYCLTKIKDITRSSDNQGKLELF